MVINQGDIYWIELEEPRGSEPGYSHPHVVVQNNVFNASRINTVIMCALTSNIKRSEAPGNVLLEKGEANLPKQSVVLVSQISTVDKSQLGEFIGTLAEHRVQQIMEGIYLMTEIRNLD
jgi:mRNA interferase MazF